jgi:predicted nuclease of predicted toxin-antitoxin system
MDCLVLTLAKNENSVFLTRDAELLSQSKVVSKKPEDFLREEFLEVFDRIEPMLKI